MVLNWGTLTIGKIINCEFKVDYPIVLVCYLIRWILSTPICLSNDFIRSLAIFVLNLNDFKPKRTIGWGALQDLRKQNSMINMSKEFSFFDHFKGFNGVLWCSNHCLVHLNSFDLIFVFDSHVRQSANWRSWCHLFSTISQRNQLFTFWNPLSRVRTSLLAFYMPFPSNL